MERTLLQQTDRVSSRLFSRSSEKASEEHGDVPEPITSRHERSNSFMLAVSYSTNFISMPSYLSGSERKFRPSLEQIQVSSKPNGDCCPAPECQNRPHPLPASCSSLVSGTSDEPVCRICHESDGVEKLVAPCYCSGSVGLLHVSCLERWLGTSNLTHCELCKYQFAVKKLPRPLTEFMHNPPSARYRTNLACDLTCFLVLTPITIISACLCVNGAQYYSQWQGTWRVQGLAALTTCLLVIYLSWLILVIHHHYSIWKKWHKDNHLVKIIHLPLVKDRHISHSSATFSKPEPALPLITRPSNVNVPHGSLGTRHNINSARSDTRPQQPCSAMKPILTHSLAQYLNNSRCPSECTRPIASNSSSKVLDQSAKSRSSTETEIYNPANCQCNQRQMMQSRHETRV